MTKDRLTRTEQLHEHIRTINALQKLVMNHSAKSTNQIDNTRPQFCTTCQRSGNR